MSSAFPVWASAEAGNAISGTSSSRCRRPSGRASPKSTGWRLSSWTSPSMDSFISSDSATGRESRRKNSGCGRPWRGEFRRMTAGFWSWAGLALLFLIAFLLSLFHASLSTFSKISLSRFLEDREKEFREKTLDLYDETRIAVESLRVLFIIAFLIDLSRPVPRIRHWPIWLFLGSLAVFFIFFDYLPRLLNSFNKKGVIRFFLPCS